MSDSRASDDGATIRRRRVCLQCNRRFTTYERVDETGINVVKRNGVREPFSRDKIRAGLAKAVLEAAGQRRPDQQPRQPRRERRLFPHGVGNRQHESRASW